MGLFDIFKSKNTNANIESFLIGYFRMETSKLLGHEVNSQQFDNACKSSADKLEVILTPLLNREIQQNIYNTLSSVSTKRINEVYGSYMILLFNRFCAIQKALIDGELSKEEFPTDILKTPDFLANALHEQIKKIIKQVSALK